MPQLAIGMIDQGLKLSVGFAFVNTLKVSLKGLENVELGLRLSGSDFARIKVMKVELVPGYQNPTMDLEILLDTPRIPQESFKKAISSFLSGMLIGELDVAVVGPITIQGGGILEEATKKLVIKLPLKEMMEGVTINPSPGAKSVFEGSNFALKMGSPQSIEIPAKMVLPASIAIPKNIDFPFTTTVSVGKGSLSTLDIKIAPIRIMRDTKSISTSVVLDITPNNTPEAAESLAQAINPLLAEPSKVIINFSDFLFNRHHQLMSLDFLLCLRAMFNPSGAQIFSRLLSLYQSPTLSALIA